MSTVYDLILVGIAVLCVLRGWRQGLAAALLRVLGWVAAAALIAAFGERWAQELYGSTVEPWAIGAVQAAIPAELVASIHSGADALRAAQSALDSLGGILGGAVIDPSAAAALESISGYDSLSLATVVVRTVLQPMLLSILRAAVSAVILIVCLFVFRMLARLTRGGGRGGILSRTNAILGGALGLVEAFAAGYIYVLLLSALSRLLTVNWLTPEILQSTRLVCRLMRL